MSGLVSREEKIAILRREFDEIDVDHNDYLTIDELNSHLDRKAGREFDRNVAMQLYERMDKNYDNKVSREEFINTFLEAEEILSFKIENSKKYIEDYQTQKRNAISRLEEIKRTETLNSYGIMDDSVLTANVIEAHNLGTGGFSDIIPYCLLKIENVHFTTSEVHSINPLWNETFSFKIDTGRELLNIEIFNAERNSDNKIGSVSINVNSLRDQLKHDEWFDLDRNGSNAGGRLHLNLQWIHSKVRFLTDVVEKWEDHIKMQNEDLYDYEKDLEILYSPFPRLQQLYRGGIRKSNYLENSYDYSKKPVVPEREEKQKRAAKVDPESKMTEDARDHLKYQHLKEQCSDHFSLIMSSIIFTFVIFLCFGRATYLDILVTTAFIGFHLLEQIDAFKLKLLAVLLGVSVILDIPWIAIFTVNSWNIGSEERGAVSLEESMNRFIVVFSFFVLFLKCFGIMAYVIELMKLNSEILPPISGAKSNSGMPEPDNVKKQKRTEY